MYPQVELTHEYTGPGRAEVEGPPSSTLSRVLACSFVRFLTYLCTYATSDLLMLVLLPAFS